MEDEYLTLRKFNDLDLAEPLLQVLRDNSIHFEIDDNSPKQDTVLSRNNILKEYNVNVKDTDYEKANDLMMELAEQEIEALDKDYYLYGYYDEELMEIVSRPDEWSPTDYILAQRLLKERGKEVNPKLAKILKKQRTEDLAKPEPSQTTWITAGYLFALLGGILGIFIGWHLFSYKKTLPDGSKVFGYNEADRKSGKTILIIGSISIFFWLIVKLIPYFRR